jgi:hypothetical protein
VLTAKFGNRLGKERGNRSREEGLSWSQTRFRIGPGSRIGLGKALS